MVPRDVQRKLQIGETEFPVAGSSGEKYTVGFSDESGTDVEVIVVAESEEVPLETVTVVGGYITTIVVGTDTYFVSYDSSGEVDDVTLVSGDDGSTRRTQQVDIIIADRRLQSCEESCAANANQLCGALMFGCNYPTGVLAALLGSLCDDVDDLCNTAGILVGCENNCAPRECRTADENPR